MAHQMYESDIKSGSHGEDFQRHIALSLLLHMRNSSSTVRLAYEMRMADKFDDIVWIDDTSEQIHLIQAKHADSSDGTVKNVDFDALFPTGKSGKRNGDFDLCKYAKSYLSVMQCLEPKAYKKMFYIFTNKDLKHIDKEWVEIEERDVNEILRFPGCTARNLKLIPTEKAIDEMLNCINKDFIVIRDAIKALFNSGTVSQSLIDYCTPLKDILTIKQKKCHFASDFNPENTKSNVAILFTMLQKDLDDMKKEVTVNNNFLAKDSRNKLLPPYVSKVEIGAFFQDFTLSVGLPNDLRPIIVSELHAWMKTWIRPDILGQMRKKDLEQAYIDLETYFVGCNKFEGNKKRFLENQDAVNCIGQIKHGMQTVVSKHIMAEAEEWDRTYINRQIKFEEAVLEPTEGMHDSIEETDILESEGKMSGNVQKLSNSDKITDKNSENTVVRQISDTGFVKELRGIFQDHQHILLIADPGMGKTSLLQFLAFEVQKQNDTEVFLVYFSTLSKELDKIGVVANLNDVCEILSAVLSEDNCNHILNAPEKRNDKGYSIILAFDAFDEMHSKYTMKVTSILKLLSFKKSIQFIISSRIHVQTVIESKFDVKLIFLVPFSEEDQILYLKKMWTKENVDEEAVENFSKHLLNKIHSSIPSNLSEISGMPLMLRMLAEIYSDHFDKLISAENTKNMEHFDLSDDKLNIVQLFEQFVKKCFRNKFVDKFKSTVDINDEAFNSMIDVYILEHQLLAIKILDIEILAHLLSKPYFKRIYGSFKSRCEKDSEKSILVKVVNNDVMFCHLSFAEYFVATCLSDNISELKPELLIKVLSQNEVIRKLTLIKLGEDETNSETLKDLFRLDWNIARWACETGCLKLVLSLQINFESFPIHQLHNMLEISAKFGYYEICAFLIGYNKNLDKCTALHAAVGNGHANVVQLLLQCKVDVNYRNDNGYTPLHIAAEKDNVSVLKQLIDNKADPNEVYKNKWTALHFACQNGNVEIVQLLIDQVLNTSSRSISGRTPLHIAADKGHANVVKLLIDNKADPNEVDEDKWTALHFACLSGNLETVQFLIDQGLNTSSRSISGKPPLHIAATKGHASVVKLLIDNKADPNEVDEDKCTALHFASLNRNLETVQLLIDQGLNTSSRSISGKTPFHIAATMGHASVVKLLINNKADPNEWDEGKWTTLHFACQNGNIETVQLLIDQGLIISSRGISGHTPLHIAADKGHASVVKLLLENKADPNEMDKNNCTALHFASRNGHKETVQFLIDQGLNIRCRAISGETPLHMAASNGHVSVVKLLIDNIADPNEVGEDKLTLLHIACRNGNVELVQLLIDQGLIISSQGISGLTPLHTSNGHSNVEKLLIDNKKDLNEVDEDKSTLFHIACQNGNVETVQLLIDQGLITSSRRINGLTPLHIAARNGRLSVVKLLLGNKANPNEVDENKWTALHFACLNGNVETVQFLIDQGLIISSRGSSGLTPLHIAARNGHSSVVKLLIDNKADPNEVNEEKSTALHFACLNGNVETVQLLIDQGLITSSQGISGLTPLHLAARNGHSSVVKLLIDNKADPNEVDENKWTALHFACQNGNVETVQLLIDQVLITSSQDINGSTPLHLAARHGHPSVVKLLIENKADPNEVNEAKLTALHFACLNGNVETVRFLINQGLNTSSQSISGLTPLHIAVDNGHSSVVKLLIDNKADPNEVEEDKSTLLHIACQNGNVETVQFLIDQGLIISSQGLSGLTPLHIAASNGHASVVKLLIENKADPNEVDENKWTALHFACQNGNVETVQFLIDQGLNTSSQSINGDTPLYIAVGYGHASVVKLLIENYVDNNMRKCFLSILK